MGSAATMPGLMQDWPLTVDRIIDHAARWHGTREVAFREEDAPVRRKSYAAIRGDAARLSNALIAHGIEPGDRVATLGMNGVRHLEAWYGIAGFGAVCHTLNPRLFADQLAFIVNHGGDRMILADAAFAPIVAALLPRCPAVERVVWLTGSGTRADIAVAQSDAADFIAGHAPDARWGGFDERSAAGLCYTSGTTGDPKGVLYSHRSNFLHALTAIQPDMFDIGAADVALPVVPMFHANAWAMTFSAPMVGAKLVLPGARLDGASLLDLIAAEEVTVAAGVPTVWLGLLDEMERGGRRPPSLARVFIGGAACPESVVRRFHALGIAAILAWGMTEMSPIGGVGSMTPALAGLPFEEQLPWRMKQGRSPIGIDMKLVGEDGAALPHDGVQSGRLHVRGPAIASTYYRGTADVLDADGYLDTGDIATIDDQGFMKITDRAKDIVKSGGEWISSIEVEAAALAHPGVELAAVIGVPHERWGERPRLYVQARRGAVLDADEIRATLETRLARWWMPDEVLFIAAMPLGATGKVDKKALRVLVESPADA